MISSQPHTTNSVCPDRSSFDTTDQNVLPLRLQYPTGIKEHIFVNPNYLIDSNMLIKEWIFLTHKSQV